MKKKGKGKRKKGRGEARGTFSFCLFPFALNRAGLAPLELVLSLPILLFVMGLMIVFGTAGAWKVRTLAASREAAWRTFWPRTGNDDPHPRGWPRSAELRAGPTDPSLFPADPFAGFDVVRGPAVVDQDSGASLPVRTETLDMTEGLQDGFARIERDFPLMQKMPPHQSTFSRSHNVLDGTRWQYRTMHIPSNITRRILFMYPMRLDVIVPELAEQFTTRALSVFLNPRKPDLAPLEGGDPEVLTLTGKRSPDFQPKIPLGNEDSTIPALLARKLLPRICEANPQVVYNGRVMPLIRRIRRVPVEMADYYIGVYRSVIQRLQQTSPPPAGATQLIQELQQKINQLNQFKATLPP